MISLGLDLYSEPKFFINVLFPKLNGTRFSGSILRSIELAFCETLLYLSDLCKKTLQKKMDSILFNIIIIEPHKYANSFIESYAV